MKKIEIFFLALVLIIFFALWVRFQGIINVYPSADEVRLSLTGMFYNGRNLFRQNPFGSHPPFYYFLTFLTNYLYFFVMKLAGVFNRPYEMYVDYIINPFKYVVIDRFLNLFLGSVLVFMTYFISQKIYKNKLVGIISAFFVAINPTLIDSSRNNLPEITVTLLSLIVIYFCYKIFSEKNTRNYLFAGLFLGLVISTKITGIMVAPLILISHILSNKKRLIDKLRDRRLYLSYVIAFFLFLFIQPFVFKTIWETVLAKGFDLNLLISKIPYLAVIKWQNSIIEYGWLSSSIESLPFVWIFRAFLNNEGYLTYLYLGGLIFTLVLFKKRDVFILFPTILSLFWFGKITTMGLDTHYLIPIFPLIIILAANFLVIISSKLKSPINYIFIIITIIFLSFTNIKRINNNIPELKRVDTRVIAADWINKNISKGKKLSLAPYSPQLFDPNTDTFAVRFKDETVKKALNIKLKKISWYIINDFSRRKPVAEWPKEFNSSQIQKYKANDYLNIIFADYHPSIGELRKEKTNYLILSSFDYYGYYETKNPYPKTNPLYYYFSRSAKDYKSILDDNGKNYKLVKEFKPGGNLTGPNLLIYEIQK